MLICRRHSCRQGAGGRLLRAAAGTQARWTVEVATGECGVDGNLKCCLGIAGGEY